MPGNKDYISRDSGLKCITSIDNMVGALYDRIGDIRRLLQDLEASDVVSRDCYDGLLAENDDLRKERDALVHKCASLEATLKNSVPVPFSVIDKKTGKYPDLEKIALEEDWAQGLMYCDMEGFALEEDGTLLLLDECGRQACCPPDRFEIVTEEDAVYG